MNIDTLIKWADEMLCLINGKIDKIFDKQQVEKKLGWIKEFSENIPEWVEILKVTTTKEQFIKHNGIYQGELFRIKGKVKIFGSFSESVGKIIKK